MARFNLRQLARQQGRRRGRRTFRPIRPTSALAADLAAIYLEAVRAWDGTLDRLMAEYERTLSTLQHDSALDLESIIGTTENALLRLFLTLTPRLRSWAAKVERWERGLWIGSALSATGIDLSTILTAGDVSETVDEAIQWNVSLVRNISDEARHRIANIVYRAVRERRPARDVAAELKESVAMSRRRALNIASDQTQKLTARLDQARQEQAGISKYQWAHSHKLHPRPVHVERDGKIFEWDNPPPDGPPGSLPFCGCRARAYIDFDDEEE